MLICLAKCKNPEYISLLQSRVTMSRDWNTGTLSFNNNAIVNANLNLLYNQARDLRLMR